MSENVSQVIELLKGMNALELADLKKQIESTFGVTAAAPMAAAAAPTAAAAAPAAEEKTSFKVELVDVGANKINVIKEVRAITGLGLKEAKDLVEAGGVVKAAAAKAEAEEIKKKLADAGATVELK